MLFSMHLYKVCINVLAYVFRVFQFFLRIILIYELSKLSELCPNNWNHILWIIVLHRYFDLRIDLRRFNRFNRLRASEHSGYIRVLLYPESSRILPHLKTARRVQPTNVCNTKTWRNESAPEQSRWRDKEKTETRQRYRQSRWHIGRRWRRYR